MTENPGANPIDPDHFVPEGEAVGEGVEAPIVPGDPESVAPDLDEPKVGSQSTGPATDAAQTSADDEVAQLKQLVAERTNDLQRLQAEYANYKKRVDRDRAQARQAGVESMVIEMLPVLDAIDAADDHGELTGGFKLTADEIHKIAVKHGIEVYGAVGDPFDPQIHEALMQVPMEGVEVTTCSQVIQKGYRMNDRIIRPARVAVAEPEA